MTNNMMRAMQLHQPQPAENSPLLQVSVSIPQPGPGQIRLRVRACGLCHTDLHTVEGDLALPRLPLIPGHQVVGIVDALGPSATAHAVGDRVGVAWMHHACGTCDLCRQGLENLCSNVQFTGLHADGGYAEYMVVDQAFAYPLPDQFDDQHAAPLLCAGIVGFRALRLSGIKPGQALGLYGFGASAHLVIQVAVHWGCRVFVFTRGAHHRRLAERLGACWTGGADSDPGQRLHASIMFAPAGWIVPLALAHLRPAGTLAINAIHTTPIPQMSYDHIYHERVLRSVANFTRQDAIDFLALAAQINVQSSVETMPLERANHALARLKRSEFEGAAVLQVSA